ncbi:MAG: hypothetical protein V3V19_11440 [Cocleimonas sp.]
MDSIEGKKVSEIVRINKFELNDLEEIMNNIRENKILDNHQSHIAYALIFMKMQDIIRYDKIIKVPDFEMNEHIESLRNMSYRLSEIFQNLDEKLTGIKSIIGDTNATDPPEIWLAALSNIDRILRGKKLRPETNISLKPIEKSLEENPGYLTIKGNSQAMIQECKNNHLEKIFINDNDFRCIECQYVLVLTNTEISDFFKTSLNNKMTLQEAIHFAKKYLEDRMLNYDDKSLDEQSGGIRAWNIATEYILNDIIPYIYGKSLD